MTHRKRAVRYRTPIADHPAARLLAQLMDGIVDATARSYEGMGQLVGVDGAMIQQRMTGTRSITTSFAHRVALGLGDRVKLEGRKLRAGDIAELFAEAMAERDSAS